MVDVAVGVAIIFFMGAMTARMLFNLKKSFLEHSVEVGLMRADVLAALAADDIDKMTFCLIRYGHILTEQDRSAIKRRIDERFLEMHPEIKP